MARRNRNQLPLGEYIKTLPGCIPDCYIGTRTLMCRVHKVNILECLNWNVRKRDKWRRKEHAFVLSLVNRSNPTRAAGNHHEAAGTVS